MLCLLGLLPVLIGGVAGALAGGVLPGSDLVAKAPTGTQVNPSQSPVINTVAGVGAVGLEEGTPFSGVRRPVDGPLVSGPPQDDEAEIGPQLVGPDGTITAVWSTDSDRTLHAARLAPEATTWTTVTPVADAVVGPQGAVIDSTGTITAVTYDNGSTPTLVSRRLAPGASTWEAPQTIEKLTAGSAFDASPEIVTSPSGVTMAGWEVEITGGQKVGGALQAANGTWPAAARDLVGISGVDLGLGAIAVPDSGRSGRLIINEFSGGSPPINVIAEQITDTGPVPMNGVPAPSQGDGSFIATDATFTPDGTLRIIGEREGGISESDVPTTNNGQLPGDPYTVVDLANEPKGGRPALATLPDGEMLLTYSPVSDPPKMQSLQLLERPAGGSWSAPRELQAPIPAGGIEVGGVAVDPGGDAYITWSTLTDEKAALAGAILDNSPPVIEGLSLPTATAGVPVGLGVTDHDAWSTTTAHWDLGDGSSAEGDNPTHTFATAGDHTVTVTVTDAAGNEATTTGTLNVLAAPPAAAPPVAPPPPAAKDTTPPKVAIAQPSCPKKLSSAVCRERRAAASSWHTVTGTVSDAGGVASVSLQATSGSGKKCVVLVAKGKAKEAPCSKAAKLKATIKGGRWTVKTPGIAKGTWKLSVLATDKAGNTAPARLTLHLTS